MLKRAKSMIWILLILLGSFPIIAAQAYEVSRQDSLYQISKWYGVSVQELRETNNLTAPYTIYSEQVIIVPPGRSSKTMVFWGQSFMQGKFCGLNSLLSGRCLRYPSLRHRKQ